MNQNGYPIPKPKIENGFDKRRSVTSRFYLLTAAISPVNKPSDVSYFNLRVHKYSPTVLLLFIKRPPCQ